MNVNRPFPDQIYYCEEQLSPEGPIHLRQLIGRARPGQILELLEDIHQRPKRWSSKDRRHRVRSFIINYCRSLNQEIAQRLLSLGDKELALELGRSPHLEQALADSLESWACQQLEQKQIKEIPEPECSLLQGLVQNGWSLSPKTRKLLLARQGDRIHRKQWMKLLIHDRQTPTEILDQIQIDSGDHWLLRQLSVHPQISEDQLCQAISRFPQLSHNARNLLEYVLRQRDFQLPERAFQTFCRRGRPEHLKLYLREGPPTRYGHVLESLLTRFPTDGLELLDQEDHEQNLQKYLTPEALQALLQHDDPQVRQVGLRLTADQQPREPTTTPDSRTSPTR